MKKINFYYNEGRWYANINGVRVIEGIGINSFWNAIAQYKKDGFIVKKYVKEW